MENTKNNLSNQLNENLYSSEKPYYDDMQDSLGQSINELDVVRVDELRLTDREKYLLDLLEIEYDGFDAVVIDENLMMVDSIDEENNVILDRYTILPVRFLMAHPECGKMYRIDHIELTNN